MLSTGSNFIIVHFMDALTYMYLLLADAYEDNVKKTDPMRVKLLYIF